MLCRLNPNTRANHRNDLRQLALNTKVARTINTA
jgi:hypothetical protein